MAQPPVAPAAFDKVIKAVGAVTTKNAFAALVVVLLFLMFVFVLILTTEIVQAILAGSILVAIVGFAVFYVLIVGKTETKGQQDIPARSEC